MSDIGGGNVGFDARFFAIEGMGVILVLVFVLVLLAWRNLRGYDLPRWPAAVLVVVALVLGPGIAIYWQIAYPFANGIEGAGRLVFGIPATLGNAMLAGLSAFAMLGRRARWVALAPAAMVCGFWLLFFL